jgi:hypothetical protein
MTPVRNEQSAPHDVEDERVKQQEMERAQEEAAKERADEGGYQ